MMKGFEPVTLQWNGENFTIPADKQMMLIAVIEDALSGGTGRQALSILGQAEGPPYTRLAAAYGAALRHAGANTTDEDVYLTIMQGFADESGDTTIFIQNAVLGIMAIIAPPVARSLMGSKADGKKPKKAERVSPD